MTVAERRTVTCAESFYAARLFLDANAVGPALGPKCPERQKTRLGM